jgi:hypothetical protein
LRQTRSPWAFERKATGRGAPRAAGDEVEPDPVGAFPLRPDRNSAPIESRAPARTVWR